MLSWVSCNAAFAAAIWHRVYACVKARTLPLKPLLRYPTSVVTLLYCLRVQLRQPACFSRSQAHPGQLRRAAVELAKTWRHEKALRQLDAVLLVADKQTTLMVMGA